MEEKNKCPWCGAPDREPKYLPKPRPTHQRDWLCGSYLRGAEPVRSTDCLSNCLELENDSQQQRIAELEAEVDKQRETINSQDTVIADLTAELQRLREWLGNIGLGLPRLRAAEQDMVQCLADKQITSIDAALSKITK